MILFARVKLHAQSAEAAIAYAILLTVLAGVYYLIRVLYYSYFINVPKTVAERRRKFVRKWVKLVYFSLLGLAMVVSAFIAVALPKLRQAAEEKRYEEYQAEKTSLLLADEELKIEDQKRKNAAEEHERYLDTILEEIPEPKGADRFFEKDGGIAAMLKFVNIIKRQEDV